MSLFTSLLPTVHKVRNQSDRLGLKSPVLAHNRLTLPQVLLRSGYWTAAVAGGGNIDPGLGFDRGFQGRFESNLLDVSELVDRALVRLEEGRRTGAPTFVFLHTYQVHGPYLPPPEYEARFAPDPSPIIGQRVALYRDLPFKKQWSIMNRGLGNDPTKAYWYGKETFDEREAAYLSDLYDGEVAYTDSQIGRLLSTLGETGQLDELVVVVLADHGEEFHEHGDFEHDQLYREHLHVPCLVRLPGGLLGGTRIAGLASLMDVMPTVLALLGLESPEGVQGKSLVSTFLSGKTDDSPQVAERVMFPDDYKAALRSPELNIIFHAVPGRLQAFDLIADPAERQDVLTTEPQAKPAAAALKRALENAFELRNALDAVDAGTTTTLSPDKAAEMRELGYVGDTSGEASLESWPEGW